MSQAPPIVPDPTAGQRPDRGGLILAFGIIGLVLCAIFGIIAWVLANSDLRDMEAGRMNPAGRGLTQAGKILGIVSVILWGFSIVITIVVFALGIAGMAVGAGAAAGAAGAGP